MWKSEWRPWHDERMRRDYVDDVRPMFIRLGYGTLLATEVTLEPNTSAGEAHNAGAAPGYVSCTQNLYGRGRTYRLFGLTHELGHVITQPELAKLALNNAVPSYKGGEYIADLLACFVISETSLALSANVERELDGFANLLEGDFMHPSGHDRVDLMKEFFRLRAGARDVRKDVLKPLIERKFGA